jgi:DNA repair photolyase
MKLRIVEVPATLTPLRKSPGFAKKQLSDYALDILGLCEYGCRYCSSNAGNYLRIRRGEFADETERQLGERLLPSTNPELAFHWPDVLARLTEQLEHHPRTWGAGKTLVFSMLTDGFSPQLVANGTTRKALDMVIAKTSFRIRILTKNACVGMSKDWLAWFGKHADRVIVGLSTGTMDDEWSKRVEINTSPPSQRLKALERLQDAGVPTYGMLCPIFPDVLNLEHASTSDGYIYGRLGRLVEAIRPDRCETVWAEPFNDRANWRTVRAGYVQGTGGWERLTAMFDDPVHPAWSRYAAELFAELRQIARRDGWSEKLVYLLYEQNIDPSHAPMFGTLEGVLLQSKPGEDGSSTNAAIAELQRANRQRSEARPGSRA